VGLRPTGLRAESDDRRDDDDPPGIEGERLALVGLGSIGRDILELLTAGPPPTRRSEIAARRRAPLAVADTFAKHLWICRHTTAQDV